jgi:3-phenylpropionate/trans-cinnamate dioxygenase ferredoxin subunit
LVCPRHGARFCIRTGAVLSPPAYEPVHCFPLRVDHGRVEVRDDRWD